MIAPLAVWRARWHDRRERERMLQDMRAPLAALAGAAAIGALIPSSPEAVLVVLAALAAGFVLLGWPDMCVPLVMFVIWSDAASVAIGSHGVPAVVGMGLPALLVVPIAHRLVFQRDRLVFHPVLKWMVGYLGVLAVGTLFARRIDLAQREIVVFVTEGLLLVFLVTNAVRGPRVLRAATWGIVLGGMFLGLLSSFQQATGTFDNDYGGFAKVTAATFGTGEETLGTELRQVRLGGPLGDQNRYAQNELVVAFLALFLAWSERRMPLRLLALAGAGFSAAGAALTFSRGAAVSFVLALGVMVLLRYIQVRHLIVVVLGAGLLLAALPQFSQRLLSLAVLTSAGDDDTAGLQSADGATRGRLNEMISAAMAYGDHPIIGVGPGMFRLVFLDYAEDAGYKAQLKPREAHNLFLGIAADTGTLGLVTFGGVLAVTLAALHRERSRWLRRRPALAMLVAGYLMMVVAYLATGVFLHMAYERFYWCTIGMACAAATVAAREAEIEADRGRDGAGLPAG